MEHRVGADGADDPEAASLRLGDGRLHFPDLLVAEQAMLPAMGVEARDRQLAAEAKLVHRLVAALDVVEQPLLGHQIAGFPQRDVTAEEKHPQPERFEHGERIVRPGQAGQHLGMPDVGHAGGLNRFLVDRRGVDHLDLAP